MPWMLLRNHRGPLLRGAIHQHLHLTADGLESGG